MSTTIEPATNNLKRKLSQDSTSLNDLNDNDDRQWQPKNKQFSQRNNNNNSEDNYDDTNDQNYNNNNNNNNNMRRGGMNNNNNNNRRGGGGGNNFNKNYDVISYFI